jgi:hypothetical protein
MSEWLPYPSCIDKLYNLGLSTTNLPSPDKSCPYDSADNGFPSSEMETSSPPFPPAIMFTDFAE